MRIGDHMDRVLEEIALTLVDLTDREPELLLDMMQRAEKIFCAGSGRSGLVMRTFAMRLMHMSLQSFVAGETTTPGISKHDLLIIGSGSGETEGLLGMAQRARQVGAQVALVTVLPESPIGKLADLTVVIMATTAKVKKGTRPRVQSVQPRGSLFEQCMFIFLESLLLRHMERTGFKPDDIMIRHANLE